MISYIDRVDFQNKSKILEFTDIALTPLRIAAKGQHYKDGNLVAEGKVHSIAVRILAGLGALFIFPLTLAALAIKWLKRNEWQSTAAKPAIDQQPKTVLTEEILKSEEKNEVSQPELPTQDKFKAQLQHDFGCVHHLDKKLGPIQAGTWRDFGKRELGEKKQTFESYVSAKNGDEWPDQKPLVVQLIGTFDEIDKKIMMITIDFLACFHQIKIEVEPDVISMEELKDRDIRWLEEKCKENENWKHKLDHVNFEVRQGFPGKNGQYLADLATDMMAGCLLPKIEEKRGQKCNLISFTTDDLYARQCNNFVFGCASLYARVGIWSKARFGDPKQNAAAFELCLLRMMKISAHEFSHMRGLHHCTDYECNIAGYFNRPELDGCPLINCLEDTAKICSLGQTSLLKYNEKLLTYFQSFNQRFELNCDFSKEIAILKARLIVLKNET